MIFEGSDFVTNRMVSPGTHLVKNHESLSRTNESQLKNNESEIGNAWAFM